MYVMDGKERTMGKRIVVVNAGPRKGWNTEKLISEAAKGAESTGAEIVSFDLFKLEKYTGCISCFGCKKEQFKGHCICRDGLTEVLDAIREADGLIIGSPNYLSNVTASFRALYERLIFQNLTYNRETPCCNEHPIPVLFIMTSNAPDTAYLNLVESYRQTFESFVGPTKVLVSGDTLQVSDYSKLDWEWSMFDPEAKLRRHEEVFPKECQKAFELGKELGFTFTHSSREFDAEAEKDGKKYYLEVKYLNDWRTDAVKNILKRFMRDGTNQEDCYYVAIVSDTPKDAQEKSDIAQAINEVLPSVNLRFYSLYRK